MNVSGMLSILIHCKQMVCLAIETMTTKERKQQILQAVRAWREQKANDGWKPLQVWYPPEIFAKVKAFGAELLKEYSKKEASND